jgi:hypothetical protein
MSIIDMVDKYCLPINPRGNDMKMPMKPMHGKTEKAKPMVKPLSKAEAAKKDKQSDAKFSKK